MYAVIMAGGAGKRFWPLSRKKRPKQLLNIVGQDTLLKQTVARLSPLINKEKVFILTGKDLYREVVEKFPEMPPENVITEPRGRNTAACLGMGALAVKGEDPGAVMALLPADHYIQDTQGFRTALEAAGQAARSGEYLVTLGIVPTRPDTGYGYIKKGERVFSKKNLEVYNAAGFVEKPDAQTAEKYFHSDDYLWNSGIFVLTVKTAFSLLKRHMPRLYQGISRIEAAQAQINFGEVIAEVYAEMDSVSFDYGVVEKASDVMVIPVSFGWSDLGSWGSVYELLPKEDGGNVSLGKSVYLDTLNTLTHSSGKLIATIGLENMIVIETEDVVFICPRDRDQDVKKLVELLEEMGMDGYL